MKRIGAIILGLSIAVASPALAQKGHNKKNDEHGKGKGKDQPTVVATQKAGSPSFCRSGTGHPKFGRAWCIEKGFGLGSNAWNRTVWSDVTFRTHRTPTIGEVLSSGVLNRLNNYATTTLHLRTPLVGTWLTPDIGGRVYLVRSGTTQVAEFVDTNGDGRAEYVLLSNR
ncbi:MAG TPA: hypothetical protein VM100_02595 [Longimicrobiales bacterium]|nr:hypothetical protein [Longimicrobiales bacterium]